MRQLFVVGVFLAGSCALWAQQLQTNETVIKLTKMGFAQEVIVTTINRSPEAFDTSPAGLAALTGAGVGALVISTMMARTVVVPPFMQGVTTARSFPVATATQPSSSSSTQRLEVKVIDKRDKQEAYRYSAVYRNVTIGKSYLLHGATFTLQLPDGRLVIANCESKFAEKMRGPAGNRRSCRMPLIETFAVDFRGDTAKLIWPVSIDGTKMQSESYKIIGILTRPKD